MPPYKTIVLEFLKEQHPVLHDRLRRNRRLLRMVNAYAAYLKSMHTAWMEQLSTGEWGDAAQVSSQALEIALEDMQESLRIEFSMEEAQPLSLEAAMAFLRRHTPRA